MAESVELTTSADTAVLGSAADLEADQDEYEAWCNTSARSVVRRKWGYPRGQGPWCREEGRSQGRCLEKRWDRRQRRCLQNSREHEHECCGT